MSVKSGAVSGALETLIAIFQKHQIINFLFSIFGSSSKEQGRQKAGGRRFHSLEVFPKKPPTDQRIKELFAVYFIQVQYIVTVSGTSYYIIYFLDGDLILNMETDFPC